MIVLDSSAMIAYLKDEPGAEIVGAFFDEADVPILAHAVNLAEVFYHFHFRADEATAQEAIQSLRADGVNERADLGPLFWREVGRLISTRRKAGANLAFGDACGLVLSRELDATFVTADNNELRGVQDASYCAILFIRPQRAATS